MSSRWIVRRQPHASTSCRLLCFSCAGGGASAFREWQAGMPQGVEVCAVQLPGRESRLSEAPVTAMDSLIDTSVSLEQLRAWQVQTSVGCVTRLLPGEHFFVQTERERLLSQLSELLWSARSSHPRFLYASEA